MARGDTASELKSMSASNTPSQFKRADSPSPGLKINLAILSLGFVLLFSVAVAAALLAYRQIKNEALVRQTTDVQFRIARVFSLFQDAETGQRGYVITGEESYLEPFRRAAASIAAEIDGLQVATADNEAQQRAVASLRELAELKLNELRQVIDLKRAGQSEQAVARVRDGAGKETMDRARAVIAQMASEEERRLEERQSAAIQSDRALQFGIVAAVLIVFALGVITLWEMRRQFQNSVAARLTIEDVNRRLVEEATQRERLGEQLRQVQKMDAIGQLTGGIAHDFNNMLAVVIGSLNLLKLRIERGDADFGQLIDGALDGAQRAATLTHRLLAFARQLPLEPQPIDANKFVAEMSDILRRTLGGDVRLETILGGGLWRTHADPSQLENAVLNLAVNARDAMRQGGKLTIETANAHLDDAYAAGYPGIPAGQYVLIAVTDTGEGMSADTIAKAFDPFFTTKIGKGTGLGLSQVYGFVRQTGGHAKIYSEFGHGTTVKLYLPRYVGAAEDMPVVSKKDWAALQGYPHESLLIVEDDEHFRPLAVQAAEELGYTVFQADSATAALRILDAQPGIALLFTDIVMPEMNGRALADEALRRRPNLKVLFTTGFTRNAIIHNGLLDPGVNFIAKPFSLEALASKLRSILEGQLEDV